MAKKEKKKRTVGSVLLTVIPIAVIVVGLVLVAIPFIEDYMIEKNQNELVSVLEALNGLDGFDPASTPDIGQPKGSANTGNAGGGTAQASDAPKASAQGDSAPSGNAGAATSAPGDSTDGPSVEPGSRDVQAAEGDPSGQLGETGDSGEASQLAISREERIAALKKATDDNENLHVSDAGDIYIDLPINTDQDIGYDAFIDPDTGEVNPPELGEEVPGTLRVEIIGRVYVPKINIHYAIVDGSGRTELKYSIGHWKTSVYPGEVGNSVLPGHRNYTYGLYYNRLDELEPGDLVYVYDMYDNIYTYEIDRVVIVEPQALYGELGVREGEELERRITLSTCHPVMVASHRLCVEGKLIDGPDWTRSMRTPLNPDRVDEETQTVMRDYLQPYREKRVASALLPGLERMVGIDQETPDYVLAAQGLDENGLPIVESDEVAESE